MTDRPLLIGAEATNPRSITIWSAIRDYFIANDFPMEYALYSTYEAMDSALLRGDLRKVEEVRLDRWPCREYFDTELHFGRQKHVVLVLLYARRRRVNLPPRISPQEVNQHKIRIPKLPSQLIVPIHP